MKDICADLRAECDALDPFVSELGQLQWQTVTPFCGWTILDQIVHLAFIDGEGVLALRDPQRLRDRARRFLGAIERFPSMPRVVEEMMERVCDGGEALCVWRRNRRTLVADLECMAPRQRLPWYGPPMGARLFATARLMETWAHGQDIYDALGRTRVNTDRLRHIAHLGVATFGWSFQTRGLPVPQVAIRVELTGPGGARWQWGEAEAADRVTGSAEDFCLVVTRRRHVGDTSLRFEGAGSARWLEIAQCFAGPVLEAPHQARCS